MEYNHLESLNTNLSSREIEDYLERFEIWCTTRNLKEDKKSANFLTSIGKDAYSLVKNLAFPEPPILLPYETLKNLLLKHVQPINFEAAERAKFHTLFRQDRQDIRQFILQLQTQAARCNFGDQLLTQLRDRLIAGINLPELQQKLLLLPNCDFQLGRTICEQYQDVKSAMTEESSVLFNSSKSKQPQNPKMRQFKPIKSSYPNNNSNSRFNDSNRTFSNCRSCGKKHSRYTCPLRNCICHNCGKKGHIKAVCRGKKCYLVDTDPINDKLTNDFDSISLAVTSDHINTHILKSYVINDDFQHSFIVDTGSVQSFISKDIIDKLGSRVLLKDTNISAKGITGHTIDILGSCELSLSDGDNSYDCPFLVIARGPSILGLDAMQLMKISVSLCTDVSDNRLRDLVIQCSKATGGMKIKPIRLELSGDPIFMKRRIIPFGLREPIHDAVMELVNKGILSPVEASSWATPIVTPLKRDGRTYRICGDYRLTLNKSLLQQSCTTLEAEDILHCLVGSKYFSKLDLKDAYLQIPIDGQSSRVTTINTPFGLFRYNFLPFGLSVSPAIFQNVMNIITANLDGVSVYQDDVIVHAPTKTLHDKRLCALLERFCNFNVTINPDKCTFCKTTFSCLGFIVDESGYRPDPSRFSKILNAPTPQNLDELRSLMGSLQYYSRFIPNFAIKADCLFQLISSKTFLWTDIHENTLRSLLKYLSTSAVLRPFSSKLHSTIITDASPTGIGAILEQNGHPILSISRRLSVAEQGYAQTQREALAVYWSVTRLHKYLFGSKFTIITDHEALKFIYDPKKSLAKTSAAMVQRWSVALSAYTYDIQHRNAKMIPHADYLSRYSQSNDVGDSDCLLVQPLPVSRSDLICETKKYYHGIISSIRNGWKAEIKRRFPAFFQRQDDISITPDGILCCNDRIIIPPSLRKSVLNDLHSGHLGVDKMKSLARLTVWWPELNSDLVKIAKDCVDCLHKIKSKTSKWIPWPASCEAWQRIHADYCGPFLDKYYALIVIDSYSKWPEVYFTTSATAEFTIHALRKVFSREGVPAVLVTDNGTHFTAEILEKWLKDIGCKHLFTAPRHPCSNGQVENFVRTLKSATNSFNATTFKDLEKGVDNFLLQYRNANHSTTKSSPAKLFKGRSLRSNMLCLESAEVSFYRGNDLRPSTGIILNNLGNRMVRILDTSDLSMHNRHIDQIRYEETGQYNSNSVPALNNDPILDHYDSSDDSRETRRSNRLEQKPRVNYKNPGLHLNCGGCGDCT